MLAGQEVTVLGAGVAGLALALALSQRGAQVTVFEQAQALGEIGAGLQLSPNGLAVLDALGVRPDLQGAPRSQGVRLYDGPSGRAVAHLDMARLRPDQDWRLVHRADLITALAAALDRQKVVLKFGARIDQVSLTETGVALAMADGTRHSPRLTLAADGLHSPARACLNPESRSFFTGQVAWRAVILNPDPEAAPEAEIHMGPGRHLVSYPLRDGRMRNLVCVEERKAWVAEGWAQQDDPAHLRAAFASFGPRPRRWLEVVESCHLWGLFRHPVAARWWGASADGQGGLALLGDAAHPTLPFMAQGANLAFEDAFVLANCLDQGSDLGTAFASYQAKRHARVTAIVAAATANARNYHLRSPLREVAHLGLGAISRFAPERLVGRYDWIYAHDVTR